MNEPGNEIPLIDINTLTDRFKGRTDFIKKVLLSIFESNQATGDKLQKAVDDRDYEKMAFIAHSIKSAAGNILATSVFELAAEAEDSARDESLEAVALSEKLIEYLQNLINEISEIIKRL